MTVDALSPEIRVYLERWTHICPVCGREFIARPSYAYTYTRKAGAKLISHYYCSWTCLRKAEEARERETPPRRRRKEPEP